MYVYGFFSYVDIGRVDEGAIAVGAALMTAIQPRQNHSVVINYTNKANKNVNRIRFSWLLVVWGVFFGYFFFVLKKEFLHGFTPTVLAALRMKENTVLATCRNCSFFFFFHLPFSFTWNKFLLHHDGEGFLLNVLREWRRRWALGEIKKILLLTWYSSSSFFSTSNHVI